MKDVILILYFKNMANYLKEDVKNTFYQEIPSFECNIILIILFFNCSHWDLNPCLHSIFAVHPEEGSAAHFIKTVRSVQSKRGGGASFVLANVANPRHNSGKRREDTWHFSHTQRHSELNISSESQRYDQGPDCQTLMLPNVPSIRSLALLSLFRLREK